MHHQQLSQHSTNGSHLDVNNYVIMLHIPQPPVYILTVTWLVKLVESVELSVNFHSQIICKDFGKEISFSLDHIPINSVRRSGLTKRRRADGQDDRSVGRPVGGGIVRPVVQDLTKRQGGAKRNLTKFLTTTITRKLS